MPKTVTKTKESTVSRKKLSVKKDDRDIRAEIKQKLDTIEENWFDIRVDLSTVYHDPDKMYENWGYETFEKYCKEELGMEYRTAMMSVQIGDAIKATGITKDKVIKLGWTKFKELSYLLNENTTKKQIEKFLKDTKGMTVNEVKDYVTSTKLNKETVSKTVTVTLKFTNEQADVWDEAIKTVMQLTSTDNPNLGAEYMAMEWSMNHNPDIMKKILSKCHVEVEAEKKKVAEKKGRKQKVSNKKKAKKKVAKKKSKK